MNASPFPTERQSPQHPPVPVLALMNPISCEIYLSIYIFFKYPLQLARRGGDFIFLRDVCGGTVHKKIDPRILL